jgi:hypothetical protein
MMRRWTRTRWLRTWSWKRSSEWLVLERQVADDADGELTELEEQDDHTLEKYHSDAVEGKYRVKRRNRGFDVDDSDEEGDEDGRSWRQLRKKRKLGEDMESLGFCFRPCTRILVLTVAAQERTKRLEPFTMRIDMIWLTTNLWNLALQRTGVLSTKRRLKKPSPERRSPSVLVR